MKVISILQPWASLIVLGHKRIETRSWNTKYRGELLIHASKKQFKPVHGDEKLMAHMTFCGFWDQVKQMPYGSIIGKVNLVDVIRFDAVRGMIDNNMSILIGGKPVDFSERELAFGDYSPGRYGWLLSDPVVFNQPIPAMGKLGLWDYDIQICKVCNAVTSVNGYDECSVCFNKRIGAEKKHSYWNNGGHNGPTGHGPDMCLSDADPGL